MSALTQTNSSKIKMPPRLALIEKDKATLFQEGHQIAIVSPVTQALWDNCIYPFLNDNVKVEVHTTEPSDRQEELCEVEVPETVGYPVPSESYGPSSVRPVSPSHGESLSG